MLQFPNNPEKRRENIQMKLTEIKERFEGSREFANLRKEKGKICNIQKSKD